MKLTTLIACASALLLAVPARAAEDDVQQLKRQLQQMQDDFEKTRRQQQQQIDALTRKLDELTGQSPATAAAKANPAKTLEQELAAQMSAGAPPARTAETAAPPVAALAQARAGSAYMNISYGALIDAGWSSAADPTAQLQLGDHDPIKRGFALRNAEIAVDGAIDPYFKGFGNIVLQLNKNNETQIELEETYLQSTSLPADLQLKAGQYFASFVRQHPPHPHTWSLVDQPLILNRAFGPEGLRGLGRQLSWLAPTPFYTGLFLSRFYRQGGTAFIFRKPGGPDPARTSRSSRRA